MIVLYSSCHLVSVSGVNSCPNVLKPGRLLKLLKSVSLITQEILLKELPDAKVLEPTPGVPLDIPKP